VFGRVQDVKRTPTQNQFAYKSSYRRNLPHIQPANAFLFLTFRLAGSLPKSVLMRMADERRKIQESVETNYGGDKSRLSELSRRHFAMLESCLDNSKQGPTWLAQPAIADVVHEALHYRDSLDYRLECYSIMPNHVHVVFAPLSAGDLPKSLSTIMHSLKRNTAKRANQLLRRSGPFWEHENFDHYIRNEVERKRIIKYVLENPIKAGLVKDWHDWLGNYLREPDAN
jgi:putative transposase